MSGERRLSVSIGARALFQFAVPCRYCPTLWTADGAELDEAYRLPNLAALEGNTPPLEVRAGWHEDGLAFCFHIFDPGIKPRSKSLEADPWIDVWIATRSMQDVHRATRHCHHFGLVVDVLQPEGLRTRVMWRGIPRAKSVPNIPPEGSIESRLREYSDGYRVDLLFRREALTGYDPREYPRLAFNYAVRDGRENRVHIFSSNPLLPYDEDPSLWATLELIR